MQGLLHPLKFPVCILGIFVTLALCSSISAKQKSPKDIPPVDRPYIVKRPQLGIRLIESSKFVRAPEARTDFNVTGSGMTAAVVDTGLRKTHVDFAGRVLTEKNFTSDNGGNVDDAADGNGHGTNVGGIIVANNLHVGIAPGASIIPLKVLPNKGLGSFQAVEKALDWVLANYGKYNITVVNMSLSDKQNHPDDNFGNDNILDKIRRLRQAKVAVVSSAGNGFYSSQSKEGMGYPGIFRETITCGAVYDANEGRFDYQNGAIAFSSGPGRITPFSQRLHESTHPTARTDIYSPGAPVTSAGNSSDTSESVQHGTSQAAPVTAGTVLLMQQYYKREMGDLPSVDNLELWIRQGGVTIHDGDDEDDNVQHTKKSYLRLDTYSALDAVRRGVRRTLLPRPRKDVVDKRASEDR